MTASESAGSGRGAWSPDSLDEAATARATVDARGNVTTWSAGAQRLLGYRPQEVVGRPAAALLDEEPPAETLRAVGALPRWDGPVTLVHRDGRHLTVHVLAHRREPGTRGTGNGDWLVLCAPAHQAAPPRDDALAALAFTHSPSTMAFYDTGLRLQRANANMERALGLPEAAMRGLRMPDIVLHPESHRTEHSMRRTLETGKPQRLQQAFRLGAHPRERVWATTLIPLRDTGGTLRGVLLSAQDMTDEYVARGRLALLNDASVRIGSTLDVARTAQELADVAVPRLADFVTVDLLPAVEGGGDPPAGTPSSPVTLRRVACQSVFEGCPEAVVPRGTAAVYPDLSPAAESLATGRPRIHEVNNSTVARWEDNAPDRAEKVRRYGFHSVLAVPMSARGTTLGVATFSRHRRPEPFDGDDLMLAEEITARAAVCIDNARRYTRERGISLTLQRSLLPQSLPLQAAVEAASRYLPAGPQSGVGGDWYDLIPLSGARVALVVGDVVGHGIQASATMGRLRTAVRTLADVDLPPDELLTQLDDLVIHLSTESNGNGNGNANAGSGESEIDSGGNGNGNGNGNAGSGDDICASCVYAVYDPVSRRCVVARAGHPAPVLANPDGTVDFLDVPAGPPLGLGGLPFESAEVELPEGSVLALYSDGLVGVRGRDIDEGMARLREILARPTPSLEATCDTILDALLPDGPTDDVALLLARTRTLDAAHVASWDVPADPAAVARTRENVSRQMAVWGLEEAAFVTELIVSELVTNAIRYGGAPIQLRLIRDRNLICEVSDASNTAPHLRRARTFDEGGRGLLLVSQLTQSWGTRQAYTGKTIWAEQALPLPGDAHNLPL